MERKVISRGKAGKTGRPGKDGRAAEIEKGADLCYDGNSL